MTPRRRLSPDYKVADQRETGSSPSLTVGRCHADPGSSPTGTAPASRAWPASGWLLSGSPTSSQPYKHSFKSCIRPALCSDGSGATPTPEAKRTKPKHSTTVLSVS